MLGRQILEGLYFLYENNLVYGHLHSGNILFDSEQSQSIKLLDITNIIAGVSSKYRYYFSNFKSIRVSRIK
jgi:PX domain-containing protein kinase-like protein